MFKEGPELFDKLGLKWGHFFDVFLTSSVPPQALHEVGFYSVEIVVVATVDYLLKMYLLPEVDTIIQSKMMTERIIHIFSEKSCSSLVMVPYVYSHVWLMK